MNIAAIKWATTHSLPAPAMHVLLVLATHADDDGLCWPSVATLCKKTGLGERTVQRSLHLLRDLGLTEVRENDKGGRNKTPRYVLQLAKGAVVAPKAPGKAKPQPAAGRINGTHHPALKGAKSPPEKGATQTVKGATQTEKGATAAPELPRKTLKDSIRTPLAPQGGLGPEAFESFWLQYPRPVARHLAERAWRRAIRQGADPEHIVAGLQMSLTDGLLDPREGGRFAPPPSAWLRGRRWTDPDEAILRLRAQLDAADAAEAARAQPVRHH
jgi:hypothetical protein